MSFAPPLVCTRCGSSIPREGTTPYECPNCRQVPPLEGVTLNV